MLQSLQNPHRTSFDLDVSWANTKHQLKVYVDVIALSYCTHADRPLRQIDTFTKCYDATEKWSGATDMKEDLIPLWKIAKNDIALVEAGLKCHYATYKMFVDGKEIKKTDYFKWQLEFKLLHIGFLASAPKTFPSKKCAAILSIDSCFAEFNCACYTFVEAVLLHSRHCEKLPLI